MAITEVAAQSTTSIPQRLVHLQLVAVLNEKKEQSCKECSAKQNYSNYQFGQQYAQREICTNKTYVAQI